MAKNVYQLKEKLDKCRYKDRTTQVELRSSILQLGNYYYFSISLTIGASRLMEAQMDLPCLLFGVGNQIFYSDASNVYVLS